MAEQLDTRTLPVLPIPNGVVVPPQVVTIALESSESRSAAAAAAGAGDELLLVPRIDDRYARVGAVARVESTGTLPDGTEALVVRATARARVGAGVLGSTSALWVTIELVPEEPPSDRARELATELRATLRALFERLGGRRLTEILRGPEDPGALADLAAWWPDLSLERRVELLETVDVEARVDKVLAWAKEALAELELAEQISRDVRDGMDQQQREFLLRQQLAAIRKELGEGGDDDDAVTEYRNRVEELRTAGVAQAVIDAVERELGRLERTPAQNIEHGWIRTWLDTVLGLPWTERTEDHLDVEAARAVLDADHTGLDDVKDRIVEFLAVRQLRAARGLEDEGTARRRPGAIIALVG
ncbi:MAG: LON peptidase substrate-binding domain-containing protein, partial [Acidimicrobiales bacterium]